MKRFPVTYQPVPTKNVENSLQLNLPELDNSDDLPTVSVITISNELSYIGSMLYIWINYIYPPKKLEWVIVEGEADIENYLPQNDDRIHYFRCETLDKLNFAVQNAKHDYIVHMHEDIFYFADSILAKIRVLEHYKRAGVLTWQVVKIYDDEKSVLINDETTNFLDKDRLATLAYNKKYWLHRQFTNEPHHFIGKKYGDWMNIPFVFNGVALSSNNSNSNSSNSNSSNSNSSNSSNSNNLNTQSEFFIGSVNKMLPEKYKTILKNSKSI